MLGSHLRPQKKPNFSYIHNQKDPVYCQVDFHIQGMCLVVWHVVCTVYSGGVGARPKKQSRTLTVRQGGRNVSFQTTLQSLLTAPCFSRNGRHWHSKHLRNQTTSGKAPETCLPACVSLFWTADPNTPHLLEWHVAAILKGDPLLRLWCPPLCPKQASHSPCSVFHLGPRFFYSGKWFLKWSRQRADLHAFDSHALPGVSKTVTEDCSKAVDWSLVNRECNEVWHCGVYHEYRRWLMGIYSYILAQFWYLISPIRYLWSNLGRFIRDIGISVYEWNVILGNIIHQKCWNTPTSIFAASYFTVVL